MRQRWQSDTALSGLTLKRPPTYLVQMRTSFKEFSDADKEEDLWGGSKAQRRSA
jgi:hypothetical protein